MGIKEATTWKRAYRKGLIADDPTLNLRQTNKMTNAAWRRDRDEYQKQRREALASRRAKSYVVRQSKDNPNFHQERATRIAELYNELINADPNTSVVKATEQANIQETKEMTAAAEAEFEEKARRKKEARMLKLPEKQLAKTMARLSLDNGQRKPGRAKKKSTESNLKNTKRLRKQNVAAAAQAAEDIIEDLITRYEKSKINEMQSKTTDGVVYKRADSLQWVKASGDATIKEERV